MTAAAGRGRVDPAGAIEPFLDRIAREPAPGARRRVVNENRALWTARFMDRLYERVLSLSRADLEQAERVALAGAWVARAMGDPFRRGQIERARGHIAYLSGRYAAALRHYETAAKAFRKLGREIDLARTLSAAINSLIYESRYEEAHRSAAEARAILARHRDDLRLARLDTNVANLLYRQDRFHEALVLYEGALRLFRRIGGPEDMAVSLRNLAVCQMALHDFPAALRTYRKARRYCERQNLPMLAAEADYNIAYLHYLRGEFQKAIELYNRTREYAEKAGNNYHKLVSTLDQSELDLELNLNTEAAELARQAAEEAKRLGVNFERAQALSNYAVAVSRGGNDRRALELLQEARAAFLAEGNRPRAAATDLYRAIVEYRMGRSRASLATARRALRGVAGSALLSRELLAHLLLARLYLDQSRLAAARDECEEAARMVDAVGSPALGYQTFLLRGEVEEAIGAADRAGESYRQAHHLLESLRGQLAQEHHKLSFLHGKIAVYENLFRLSVSGQGEESRRKAFAFAEQAKSRVLADLMRFRATSAARRAGGAETRLQSLRRELVWRNRQMERLEETREPASAERRRRLAQSSRECEQKLLRAFTASAGAGALPAAEGATADIDAIRAALPADSILVEYFVTRDALYACLLEAGDLRVVPVAAYSEVRGVSRLLQFQMARQARGAPDETRAAAEEALAGHLRRLYELLMEPIAAHLRARHLVVAPHGVLHHVPFHALHDGQRSVIDRHVVTYTPSGSVYALSARTVIRTPERSLVLGCPDAQAPHIEEEARGVAALLPNARLFTGRRATEGKLREFGPDSRFVHIATHGFFRRENPMFSSIRLGRSFVHLFDLYGIRLPAELVTLSGCSTGMSLVAEGDELLGLVRGLMYAGARTVQVSLWDVNDRSAATWMRCFYSKLRQGAAKAEASRATMLEMRAEFASPYHWAPFILLGKES